MFLLCSFCTCTIFGRQHFQPHFLDSHFFVLWFSRNSKWTMFLNVQLKITISSGSFSWLVPNRQQTITWSSDCSIHWSIFASPGPLFTKRMDVLPQDRVMSRSRETHVLIFPITLKFDKLLGRSDAEMPVKFQSDTSIITSNLVVSRLHEILR